MQVIRLARSKLAGGGARASRHWAKDSGRTVIRFPGRRPPRRTGTAFGRTFGLIALAGVVGIIAWAEWDPSAQARSRALPSSAIDGPAAVIDGDTLDIHGQRIRLHGIDAPERAQICQDGGGRDYRCGQRARRALSDKVRGRPVSCQPRDVDHYGRVVAVCRSAGEDLNRWLVRRGWAIADSAYSARYAASEVGARLDKRGIWAGDFVPPAEWRRRNR